MKNQSWTNYKGADKKVLLEEVDKLLITFFFACNFWEDERLKQPGFEKKSFLRVINQSRGEISGDVNLQVKGHITTDLER